MIFVELPRFRREFKKLGATDQTRVCDALAAFRHDPTDQKLRNHPLKGTLTGLRSITAGYDLRIVVRLWDGRYEIVSLVSVGTHARAYRGK